MFSLAVSSGAIDRRAITVTADSASAKADDRRGLDADGDARSAGAGARPRTARARDAVVASYPLGLWRGWAYVHFPLTGIVYPAPEAHPPPLPSGAQGIDPHATGRGDDADLAGLREYQRGDPLQRVAWKAVARGAGWFSKEFEGAGGGGPITLDWSRLPAHLDAEARLSRLAAWVLAAERDDAPVRAGVAGRQRCRPGPGASIGATALTALALVPGDTR